MATTDVLNWLVENGPATREEIVEKSDLSENQVDRNISKMGKWIAYYNISVDESSRPFIYDAEKK